MFACRSDLVQLLVLVTSFAGSFVHIDEDEDPHQEHEGSEGCCDVMCCIASL